MEHATTYGDFVTVQAYAHRMIVVGLPGDVVGSCMLLTRVLEQRRLQPHTLVHFDATRVNFIDSSGLSALVMTANVVRRGGGFVSMRASARIRRIVEMCRMGSSLGLPALLPGVTRPRPVGSQRAITRGPASLDRRNAASARLAGEPPS